MQGSAPGAADVGAERRYVHGEHRRQVAPAENERPSALRRMSPAGSDPLLDGTKQRIDERRIERIQGWGRFRRSGRRAGRLTIRGAAPSSPLRPARRGSRGASSVRRAGRSRPERSRRPARTRDASDPGSQRLLTRSSRSASGASAISTRSVAAGSGGGSQGRIRNSPVRSGRNSLTIAATASGNTLTPRTMNMSSLRPST